MQISAPQPVAIQHVQYYPGQKLPQFVNTNPGSVQLYQGILQFFQQQMDDKSTIQGVNRGAPEYDLSGKAVKALQSEADLFGVLPRKAVESGLRQATMLSLACMMKYMHSARLVRVTPKAAGKKPYAIFAAQDEKRATAAFNLSPETARMKVGEKEKEVRTGSYVSASTGDTGREARKDERLQLVQTFLGYTGPAAGIEVLLWAADLMEVPNPDKLAEALRKEDGKTQIFNTIERAAKAANMDISSIIQLAVAAAQQAATQAEGGGAPGGNGTPAAPAAPAAPAPAGGVPA